MQVCDVETKTAEDKQAILLISEFLTFSFVIVLRGAGARCIPLETGHRDR